MSSKILTIARLKPSDMGQSAVESTTETRIDLKYRGSTVGARLDKVFDNRATQKDVFEYVSRKVLEVILKSVSCSVLAYGHTGAGKTYTMYGAYWSKKLQARNSKAKNHDFYGYQSDLEASDFEETLGVIPRTVEFFFNYFRQLEREENSTKRYINRISVKFFQIYNERVIDLLSVALK